ncbi:MAG: hypothetical protein H3C43_12955, partial [Leptonema sp. (in: Bacteria)]|nr:hypothetical protein [Leptonema sp. (in: bacteria)]
QTTAEDKSDQTKTAQTTTEDKSDQSKTTTEDKSISDGFLSLPNNTPLTQASVLWPTAPDKAIKIIDKAIVDNPKDANLYSLKCEIYYKSSPQQLQEALQSCNQASRLSPDFRNLQNQGRVEEAMKNSKSAYESYRQALDRKMEVDLAYHTIEIGDTLPNKQAETRAILERLLSRQPDHKAGLLLLMKRQQQENNRIGLQSTTERLQSLYPDDDQLLIEMATVLLSQPETKDQAIQLLRRYYHSKPDDVKAGLTLAGLYLQKEDEKQALQILGELYENFPTNYDIVRTILILFVRQNQNLDSAETMVTKYLNSTEPTEEERQNIIQILPESLQMKIQPTTQETTPNSEDQNLKNEKEKPNVQQNSPVQP